MSINKQSAREARIVPSRQRPATARNALPSSSGSQDAVIRHASGPGAATSTPVEFANTSSGSDWSQPSAALLRSRIGQHSYRLPRRKGPHTTPRWRTTRDPAARVANLNIGLPANPARSGSWSTSLWGRPPSGDEPGGRTGPQGMGPLPDVVESDHAQSGNPPVKRMAPGRSRHGPTGRPQPAPEQARIQRTGAALAERTD